MSKTVERSLKIASILLGAGGVLMAQGAAKRIPVPPPPMGWSSWNSFSNTVDSAVVMEQAKAMVDTGMARAGYRYINIDEGWWLGTRDGNGNIVVDKKAWPAITPGEQPGDMANIVRFIHSLGLKAGIYTDAGKDGCSTVAPDLGPAYPHTGSEGHYEQDFLQFARWGFDYVKVDWCGGMGEKLDPDVQYREIARAINRAEAITGHRLYFSICNWGVNSPWTWAPGIGGVPADIWRTGGDIVWPIVANTKNSGRRAEMKEVFREFGDAAHPEAQHTGFYNDPDMMVVGMPGLTEEGNRVHMSLWAILGGPLMVGADLTRLSDAARATLTNPDAIAVDQDSLGLQAVKVSETAPGLEVWSKRLAGSGRRAVVLLNRSNTAASITVQWSELDLLSSSPTRVRAVWDQTDLGTTESSYSATIPAGDLKMLLVQGRERPATRYTAVEAVGHQSVADSKDKSLNFVGVTSQSPVAGVEITYRNPDKQPRAAELRVNGRSATRICFPSTGSVNSTAAIWVESVLDRHGAKNELSFSAVPGDAAPAILSISVQ